MQAHRTFSAFAFLIVSVFSLLVVPASAFAPYTSRTVVTVSSTRMNSQQERHPFCDLPGDPSLIIVTNVDLGDKKLDVMKGKGKWALACRCHK